MSEQNASTDERPSLRVAELTIENFRTFRERTVIPFSSSGGEADAIATFHGRNGSGKSNAIAALHFFLRTVRFLVQKQAGSSLPWHWDQRERMPIGIYEVRRRDHPIDTFGSMEISARFTDERLGSLAVRVVPAGSELFLEWEGSVLLQHRLRPRFRSWLETPLGPESRPMGIVDAGRRASWVVEDERKRARPKPHGKGAQPELLEQLFAAKLSQDPRQRARWRAFKDACASVPLLAHMELDINRPQKDGDPELTFEERDKIVLRLEELSSGEHQLVVLFAAVLLANAPIVAIEEPELSLDAKSQQLFRNFLQDLVQKRRIDQAIIESHVAAFDGPNVIRFHRDPGGPTTVTREPVATAASQELAKEAEAQGAKQRWVTADGFTRLPDGMREELHVGGGKHVWFLRGPERWEAWPEEDLDKMLGGGER